MPQIGKIWLFNHRHVISCCKALYNHISIMLIEQVLLLLFTSFYGCIRLVFNVKFLLIGHCNFFKRVISKLFRQSIWIVRYHCYVCNIYHDDSIYWKLWKSSKKPVEKWCWRRFWKKLILPGGGELTLDLIVRTATN